MNNFIGNCLVKRALDSTNCIVDLPSEIPPTNDEVYGPHSRCFNWKQKPGEGEQTATACHLSKCVDGKIMVKFKSGKVITCKRSGEAVDVGLNYNFMCPDIGDFCSDWANRCPMDCNANGVCMGGNKCFCFVGFSGDDCVRS